MVIKKFEDIIAWQKAGQLVMLVYMMLINCRDYRYKNQIQSAAVSVMNNIAEGFERRTNNEFRNFLFIAKGSSGEVRSMLYIGLRLNYFNESNFNKAYKLTVEISKCLSGLIKTL